MDISYISGPYSLTVYNDELNNKIFIFGEIHNSINDCINENQIIKISDLIEHILNTNINQSINILLETDNLKLNNTDCYRVDVGEFLNLISLQKKYMDNHVITSVDLRYDTNLGRQIETLYSLVYNQKSYDEYKINSTIESCMLEIQDLINLGIIEYLNKKLNLEKMRFFSLYNKLYDSNYNDVRFITDEINEIIQNNVSNLYKLINLNNKDYEEYLYVIETVNYGVMDIFTLLNILDNKSDNLIIYAGNDHAQIYSDVLNKMNTYELILQINTNDYNDKCLYVEKICRLYDLIIC